MQCVGIALPVLQIRNYTGTNTRVTNAQIPGSHSPKYASHRRAVFFCLEYLQIVPLAQARHNCPPGPG